MRRLARTVAFGGAMATVAAVAVGCAEWPRYLHMEEDDPFADIVRRITVFEDESLDGDTLQDLGIVDRGTEVLFSGFLTRCGYDEEAAWPVWPLHDFDTDNDGVPDTQIAYHSGWYAGDVDWIGFTPGDDGRLDATLEWVNRPAGESNATYQPEDPEGAWAEESDLDLVLFDVAGTERFVANESGISTAYPQQLVNPGSLTAESPVAVAIGCHHNVPTDFDLRLVVR